MTAEDPRVNESCWARCLGDCSLKISREHVISRALFSTPTVRVAGWPWAATAKEVGLNALTKKILCTRHNSELGGGADVEAAHLMECLDKALQIKPSVAKDRVSVRLQISEVNLPLLERWALKTLINITVGSEYVLGVEGGSPGAPSDALVAIAFGQRQFSGRAGLYFATNVNLDVREGGGYAVTPFADQSRQIVGASFFFKGIHMTLWLDPKEPPQRVPFSRPEGTAPPFAELRKGLPELHYAPAPGVVAIIRFRC